MRCVWYIKRHGSLLFFLLPLSILSQWVVMDTCITQKETIIELRQELEKCTGLSEDPLMYLDLTRY